MRWSSLAPSLAPSLVILSFFVVVVAAPARPARACDPRSTSAVVGFDKASTQALIREEGPGILLYPVDLKTGKKGDEVVVLTLDEYVDVNEQKTKSLRGARWKTAEAALVARGFVIAPGVGVAKDGVVADGVKVGGEDGGSVDDDSGFSSGALVARGADGSRVVLDDYAAPPSDLPSYTAPVKSPDGKHFVVERDGCGVDVLVFAVDDVKAKLAAAKKKQAPASQPKK